MNQNPYNAPVGGQLYDALGAPVGSADAMQAVASMRSPIGQRGALCQGITPDVVVGPGNATSISTFTRAIDARRLTLSCRDGATGVAVPFRVVRIVLDSVPILVLGSVPGENFDALAQDYPSFDVNIQRQSVLEIEVAPIGPVAAGFRLDGCIIGRDLG